MKKLLFYSYVSLMPPLFLAGLLLSGAGGGAVNFTPLIASFLIFYGITLVKAFYLFGVLSLYAIFLSTNIFFIYGKLITHLVGYSSFLRHEWPVTFTVSERTGLLFICAAFLSHYIMDTIYAKNYKKVKFHLYHYPQLEKCGLLLMLLSLPGILYKLIVKFLFVRVHGYLSVYNGELDELTFPIWTRGTGTVFIIAYLLVLFAYPNKSIFVTATVLFLAYSLADSMKGGRSAFLSGILVSLYFYSKFYNVKFKLKTLVIMMVFFLVFAIVMGSFRNNYKMQKITLIDLLLYGLNGGSSSVPMLIIENQGAMQYRHYPFIFTPFFSQIQNILYPHSGQDTQDTVALKHHNILSHEFMHKMAPNLYYSGAGFGSSFLAEIYDCGSFAGVIVIDKTTGYAGET